VILARQSKRKFVPLHATQPHVEMVVQLHSLLRLWMDISGHLHAPAALHSAKEPRYPLDWRLGALQSRTGRSGEGINPFLLTEIELRFLGRTAHSLVTTPTTLYCNTI
jgi:hypothetical protein